MIPPLTVVAFRLGSNEYFFINATENQTSYTIENLLEGSYQIVAYTNDRLLAGGYSQAVLCGLSVDCNDHSLIHVQVIAGQETTGVDPGDWYAPEGSFPASPIP